MKTTEKRTSANDDPGRGTKRYRRYRAVFQRALQAQADGYPLEGIAIIDSLLTDRLASRLGYVTHDSPSERLSCGQVCHRLMKGEKAPGSPKERDPEFRDAISRIQAWVRRRNHALHALAKSLPKEDGKPLGQLIEEHNKVLSTGIDLLLLFDKLDRVSRKSNKAKRPATAPSAFTLTHRGSSRG